MSEFCEICGRPIYEEHSYCFDCVNKGENKKKIIRCSRCGRKLKKPLARMRGVGDTCYEKNKLAEKMWQERLF